MLAFRTSRSKTLSTMCGVVHCSVRECLRGWLKGNEDDAGGRREGEKRVKSGRREGENRMKVGRREGQKRVKLRMREREKRVKRGEGRSRGERESA